MTAATQATISADYVRLLLASAKLRAYTGGRTCLLAAMSPAPKLECDCAHGRRVTDSWRDLSMRSGHSRVRITPISRGHISRLIDRVARERGRAEVIKTWGAGVKALRAEPRFTLHGGKTQ